MCVSVWPEVRGGQEALVPRNWILGCVALFRGHGSGSSGFTLGCLVLWKMFLSFSLSNLPEEPAPTLQRAGERM